MVDWPHLKHRVWKSFQVNLPSAASLRGMTSTLCVIKADASFTRWHCGSKVVVVVGIVGGGVHQNAQGVFLSRACHVVEAT
jgi:hypothetical protein